ncbi:hypothetical protein AX16_003224 [Volvariella volvacea WC 439]|nr:hypothetical protein AX16_003224 [Volvariella volvacea WC 439]
METLRFPSNPPHLSFAHIALFKNVKNASDLRDRIVSASTSPNQSDRDEVNYAFINPTLITSKLHLQTAIAQATLSDAQGSLRTKTVHSEILWALNPTHNITEALRRYGISPTSTSLLLIRIDGPAESPSAIQTHMTKLVDGDLVPFEELSTLTDWATIKKYHKLNEEQAIKSAGGVDRERAVVDNIVVTSVAMKSVMS